MSSETQGFGLIVVGNEILDGRRSDAHFSFSRDLLKKHGFVLRYSLFLPATLSVLVTHFRWAFTQPDPFFCCGGIGSTPDDLTRQAAAEAAGVALAIHPEGLTLLQDRFGSTLTASRRRLVEFPTGAALIPNPFNRVPGFSLGKGYFLPGFPEMAHPMMEWVLQTREFLATERCAVRLILPGVREGDLVPLMEIFVASHPSVSFSSLPRFTEEGGTELELGLSGAPTDVRRGLTDLQQLLRRAGVKWRE